VESPRSGSINGRVDTKDQIREFLVNVDRAVRIMFNKTGLALTSLFFMAIVVPATELNFVLTYWSILITGASMAIAIALFRTKKDDLVKIWVERISGFILLIAILIVSFLECFDLPWGCVLVLGLGFSLFMALGGKSKLKKGNGRWDLCKVCLVILMFISAILLISILLILLGYLIHEGYIVGM